MNAPQFLFFSIVNPLSSTHLSLWESNDASAFVAVFLQGFRVDAFWVEDGAVVLDDADASGASASQVTAGVEADVAEALDDESLAAPSGSSSDLAHVRCLVDEVLQAVEHTATGGGHAAVDAALVDGFAGDASVGVDVVVSNRLGVRVGDPAHLALAGSHVGCWHVNAWADEALLRQLQREATRNLLQFIIRVFFGVDLEASLGAAERNINASALECHQSRQSFDFIARHVHRVTNACKEGGDQYNVR